MNRIEMTATEAMEATIRINGEVEPFRAGTLAGLLEQRGIDSQGRGVAIAINGAVVPRATWSGRQLAAGDEIEIVQAKQGG
jgi:sulfur carrier protein